MIDDRPFATADGIWTATAGSESLCDSCERRSRDPRTGVMCEVDGLRTFAWTCRAYTPMPGSFG